jgi:hypothetical protein
MNTIGGIRIMKNIRRPTSYGITKSLKDIISRITSTVISIAVFP